MTKPSFPEAGLTPEPPAPDERAVALTGRLADAAQSALFRLAENDRAALVAAAQALGHACFEIDVSAAPTVPGLTRLVARTLAFPAWFGGTLDSLNDCLTDLSWRPAAGYVLVLQGAGAHSGNPAFAILNEVFASAASYWRERGTPFNVVYLQPGDRAR